MPIPIVPPPLRETVPQNAAGGLVRTDPTTNLIPPNLYISGTASRLLTNGYGQDNAWWQVATKKADGSNITDADVDNILFYKASGVFYKRFFDGPANVRWWGVIPTDGVDDYPLVQTAVDACIRENIQGLYFPSGEYQFSRGIKIRKGGTTSTYVGLSLHGDGNAYDPFNIGGGAIFKLLDATGACIYVQRGKGLTIENIRFRGQNTGCNYNEYEVTLPSTNWFTNGVSYEVTNKHCAVAIDAIFDSSIANKYALETALYTENSAARGGSTQIKIKNVYIQYFATGIVVSPSGMQNGENIFIENPWIDHCHTSISTGEVQNRTVVVKNYTSWGSVFVHFDSERGTAPHVIGANIAGGSAYLCKLNDWYGEKFAAQDIHAELLYAIGGHFGSAQVSDIWLKNCKLFLTGSVVVNGVYVHKPNQIVQCGTFVMEGGMLVYYTGTKSMFGVSVKGAKLEGVQLTSPLINSFYARKINYEYCELEGFNNYAENVTQTSTPAMPSTVANVNHATDTWTYTCDQPVEVGNYVRIYNGGSAMLGEFGAGGELTAIPAGVVTNVSGGVVTVAGIPYGLVNGLSIAAITIKLANPA